ncbi:unnamed protein product, partial [marine sediment metagenome]
MKEFEKWLLNTKHANWTWEEDAKEAWKAALEWVANKCRGRRSEGLENLLEKIDKELLSKQSNNQ